ncbi:MAG: EF-hand domain-containing protein [Pseudomonadota bacterium]
MKTFTIAMAGGLAVVSTVLIGTAIAQQDDGAREGRDGRDRGERAGREVTKDQFMERARGRFGRLDVDGDGTLSREEIAARVGRRMERRMERIGRRAERMLRRRDTDGDGSVSQEEFRTAALNRFRRVDLNGDGVITDDDLPPRLRGRNIIGSEAGPRRGRRLLRGLRQADANNDGRITQDEATAASDARFARFDRNSDGKLDQADREAFQQETRDYRVERFLHRFEAREAGSIARSAFMTRAEERFARRDLNNDGVLRGGELRRGRGRGRGRGWRHRGRHQGRGHHRGRHNHRGGRRGGPDRAEGQNAFPLLTEPADLRI